MTPKLTLNLGLRYDFATPATEAKNRMANFNPAGSGSLVFASGGGLDQKSLVNPNTTDFGPRIGASYSVANDTVLRGGFGMYYTSLERIGSEDQLALNPPFLINKTIASNTNPVIKPSDGFPSNFFGSVHDQPECAAGVPHPLRESEPAAADGGSVELWGAAGVCARLDSRRGVRGTHSTNLDVLRDYNQPIISGNKIVTSSSAPSGTVPYPNFGQIEYLRPVGFGNYSGLRPA